MMASREARIFLFFNFFGIEIILKTDKRKILKLLKKGYQVGTYELPRPVDRKQNYFKGWPKVDQNIGSFKYPST